MLRNFIKRAKKAKRGFTLIELIVVIAILAILAAVLVPTIGGQIGKAQSAAAKSDSNSAFMAATLYQSDATQNPSASLVAIPAGGTYTSTDGTSFVVGTGGTAAGVTDCNLLVKSPEFSALYQKNGFKLTSITVDANGAISSVSIQDNNSASSDVTYPVPSST